MLRMVCLSVTLALLAGPSGGCRDAAGPPAAARRFTVTGQVLSLEPARSRLIVHHDDIPGFMEAMTMPFTVKHASVLGRLQPGDTIRATLVVGDEESWLEGVERTGTKPLPAPPKTQVADDIPLLRPGEVVPDETFTDQDGRKLRFSSLAGSTVVVTFIYTRCPLPDYCPLMDRRFASIQAAIKAGRVKTRVALVSVSFDPDFDTATVLRQHAASVGADPRLWRLVTAERKTVETWGARFGLSVLRAENDPSDITHNLRTAIVDLRGRLVKIHNGNQWTAGEVVADLAALPPE